MIDEQGFSIRQKFTGMMIENSRKLASFASFHKAVQSNSAEIV